MEDLRLGRLVRALRIRRGWRQQDLADRAGVSRTWISHFERGHIDGSSVRAVRKTCAVLDVRLEFLPRSRGGDLDKIANAAHAQLHESVGAFLATLAPWEHVPEVSFSIYGERGLIDILAWHPGHRALVVIELKTEIVDPQEIVGSLDRKRRLAARIAQERGWRPESVSVWLIVADSSTNRRRIAAHRTLFNAALPADGRSFRSWLQSPSQPTAGIAFWSSVSPGSARSNMVTTRRVRRRRRADSAPTEPGAEAAT